MKKLKKSLIVMYCLSAFCTTGQPLHFGEGIFMKLIPLSNTNKCKGNGQYFTQVDDEDYDELIKSNWQYNNRDGNVYAQRHETVNGKRTTIRMHRQIMKLTNPKIFIDHIDHDGLNNQKSNLRTCTNQQNARNTSSRPNSSSKYLGVIWEKRRNHWVARINPNKKLIYLGSFNNEEDAARAYDKKAFELFGEFANLNFK